jgi:hypothetical protein
MVLCEEITATFGGGSSVQKLYNRQAVEDIVLGNLDHLDNYPSITIEAKTMDREPFTIESVAYQHAFVVSGIDDRRLVTYALRDGNRDLNRCPVVTSGTG